MIVMGRHDTGDVAGELKFPSEGRRQRETETGPRVGFCNFRSSSQ